MAAKTVHQALGFCCLSLVAALTGCGYPLNTTYGPTPQFPVPIPVSPYFQDMFEDKYWMTERYERVPVLGPVTAGGPPVALDPPSQDEIWRALVENQHLEGGLPFLWERQLNNVRMTIEPIADYIDPPRVYPIIGPAQLHHAHYKCTIYFTEVTRVGWPVPYTTVDEDASEVIYLDHNHFHMVGNVDDPSQLPPGAPLQ
jgi:hypothetical protein